MKSVARSILVLSALAFFTGCPSTPDVPDAPREDAPFAPLDAPACGEDADCDDGLYCNGVESCDAGRCVAGATPCDDEVDCTTDYCSEDQRRCLYEAPDVDGDGYRSAACLDARGAALGTDCDDDDIRRYPGALEMCDEDGLDEDCDPTTLGGTDADMDGAVPITCCNDQPDGTSLCGTDCNDARASERPGATEICDTIDNDCDGMIDESLTEDGFVDADRDGFGDDATPTVACPGASQFSTAGGDCNDASAAQRPMQAEFCDTLDNDCDGTVDEDAAPVPWYRDLDGDGFGASVSGVVTSCEPVPMATLLDNDCDDTLATTSPGATELCDGRDTNCNGRAEFVIAPGDTEDDDRDGVADLRCGMPFGTDCDDGSPLVGPGSVEACDLADNDCDGIVDEGAVTSVFYRDLDGDSYGSAASGTVVQCGMPAVGYVTRGDDCSDGDVTRFPGASELCNGADDDCDAATDESPASTACIPVMGAATASCTAGACRVATCAAGRADCDGSFASGCEVDVSADPLSCGTCGNVCAGGLSCTAGICAGSFLSPGATISARTRPVDATYVIDTTDPMDAIYYTTDGTIPGLSATTLTASPPVSVPLTNGQTLRWYRSVLGGTTDAIRSFTHTTSAATQIHVAVITRSLSLAGQGPVAAVARGSSVSVSAEVHYWKDSAGGACPGCITQGVLEIVGVSGGVISCIDSIPPWPGTTPTITTSFTAPASRGRYYIMAGLQWQTSCAAVTSGGLAGEIVGVIDVF